MKLKLLQSKIGVAVRVLLSAILISILVYQIGSPEILEEIKRVHWPILGIIVFILAAAVFIITPRWAILIAALGHEIKASLLFGSVVLGVLFNQLLPTAVGGDVLRVLRARELGIPTDLAIHSVLLDRASGLLVVLVGALALLPFSHAMLLRGGLPWFLGVAMAAAFAATLGFRALSRLHRINKGMIGTVQRAVVKFDASVMNVARHPRALIGVLALSTLGQLNTAFAIGLLAAALNVHLPIVDVALVSFCAMLAGAIPLSLAGWGIREGALVFVLGLYGVAPDIAFAISILFGACQALASTPGVLLLFGSHPRITLRPITNNWDQ